MHKVKHGKAWEVRIKKGYEETFGGNVLLF